MIFAYQSCLIMILLQNGYQVFRIINVTHIVIGTYMSCSWKTAGKHGTTCRSTGRHNRICFIEPSVLMCQFINKWSNIHRKTFASTQIGTLLVCHYHYDIRFVCLCKQRQTYSLENDSRKKMLSKIHNYLILINNHIKNDTYSITPIKRL